MKEYTIKKLEQRGVTIDDMVPLVLQLQIPYLSDLTLEECRESVLAILDKRDFQHTILTGIAIDELAEKNLIEEPLLSILKNDDGLYGVDEILAIGTGTLYGTIGSTNFGYLDKTKPGIVGRLDSSRDKVNTFLDDLVCAVVAAAASRLAHKNRNISDKSL